jgi:hypothetical protein
MSHQCPQLEKLPDNIRKFWEDKQTELEDTLIRFSYAILTIPTQFAPIEKNGILYLMKRNLWFEDFQKPPFFIFMRSSSQYKKTIIQMPLETLENFEVVRQSALEELITGEKPRLGFFHNIFRLMRVDPIYLFVSGKETSGNTFQYAFRELDDPESWSRTLSAAITES